MKLLKIIFVLTALWFGIQTTYAQDLESDITAAQKFVYGQNLGGVRRFRETLYSRETPVEQRQDLIRRLVAIFPQTSPDGQQEIRQLLWTIAGEEDVLPLVPLLSDTSVTDEAAQLTRFILEYIPGEKIDAALLDALSKTTGVRRMGLANALAHRRVQAALPVLETILQDTTLTDEEKQILNQAVGRISGKVTGTEPYASPYDPDQWPGDVAGKAIRVDMAQVVAELGNQFLAEKDAAKKKELALQIAGKASLMEKPTVGITEILNRVKELNEQKMILDASGIKCSTEDMVAFMTELMQKSEPLRATSGLALVRMANQIRRADPPRATELLNQVVAQVGNADVENRAKTVLATISESEGAIRTWACSGPYTQENKLGREIFDTVFPPEDSMEAIDWQPMFIGWTGGNRWNLESGIAPVLNAAAYLRTIVWSETDQELVFHASGSSGLKVWCNDQLILNEWQEEPFRLWRFQAPVTLHKGRNIILVKSVREERDWLFSARLRTPENGQPQGITFGDFAERPDKILLFTGTQNWIHGPIVSGEKGGSCCELVLRKVCTQLGYDLVWSDRGDIFDQPLDDYAAIVFYTCGALDQVGPNQNIPIAVSGHENFFKAIKETGTGFLGIHAAADPWGHEGTVYGYLEPYVQLVGAKTEAHGMQQDALVRVTGNELPRYTAQTGKEFRHFTEWYSFTDMAADIHGLMFLDTGDMFKQRGGPML